MSAYVYLLWHKSEPRFKIGKADNVHSRLLQLGMPQFDLSRTKLLELGDCAQALNLERVLHRLFQRYRLIPGESAPMNCPELRGVRQDGDTEWFSAECWGRLHTFIEQNEDLLDCSWVTADATKKLVNPYGDMQRRGEYREQNADIRILYGNTWYPPMNEPAEKSTIRWNRLNRFGLVSKLELKRQNGILETVDRMREALESLAQTCQFVAVVQTPTGYKLVGEAPRGAKSTLTLTLEKLRPLLNGKYSASRTWTRHFFTLDLRGGPGQLPEAAPDYNSWLESLVWAQTPAIPGFDVMLRQEEANRAFEILNDVFGVGKAINFSDLPIFAN